jgi:hypothetical protein
VTHEHQSPVETLPDECKPPNRGIKHTELGVKNISASQVPSVFDCAAKRTPCRNRRSVERDFGNVPSRYAQLLRHAASNGADATSIWTHQYEPSSRSVARSHTVPSARVHRLARKAHTVAEKAMSEDAWESRLSGG